jgi:hypothetical protein
MVGLGSNNSQGSFDNVRVQKLPPEITFEDLEDFSDGEADLFTGQMTGDWAVTAERYHAVHGIDSNFAFSLIDLAVDEGLGTNSLLELEVTLTTEAMAGFVFDFYSQDDFKFVTVDVASGEVLIGHYTAKAGLVYDVSAVSKLIRSGKDIVLGVTLKGATVSVSLGGYAVAGHAYNAVTLDGDFGLLAITGGSSFDNVSLKTNDPAFREDLNAQNMMAAQPVKDLNATTERLTQDGLAMLVDAAINRWADLLGVESLKLEWLKDVEYLIADLEGGALGWIDGQAVLIDNDAAGYGWFIDTTADEDSEYLVGINGDLKAMKESDAFGRMDLLTVLSHEIGHLLGFGHDADTLSIMADTLDRGTRLLITVEQKSPDSNVSQGVDHLNKWWGNDVLWYWQSLSERHFGLQNKSGVDLTFLSEYSWPQTLHQTSQPTVH